MFLSIFAKSASDIWPSGFAGPIRYSSWNKLRDAFIQLAIFNHARVPAPVPSYPSRRYDRKQIIFISYFDDVLLASKFKPPVVKPPALRISYITSAFLFHTVRELVGVPAQLRIATVGVDRTEQAKRNGGGYFMMERVTCQRRVVSFNVQFNLFSRDQTVSREP